MEKLQIRSYNIMFGDAILVSFPESSTNGGVETRHILIDVGNALFKGDGGADYVFKPIMDDILDILDGQPLDLYVMTHEHLDHIQGLPYAANKIYTSRDNELRDKLQTRYAWLTASSAENYYETHSDAKKQNLALQESYVEIDRYLQALQATNQSVPDAIRMLWVNNDPRKTKDCVAYLRKLAAHTYYVHRDFDPQDHHAFQEAEIEIWAPEENTAEYYGRFQPINTGLGVTMSQDERRPHPSLTQILPPRGVDMGAFYNLVTSRRRLYDYLLAIDCAANNTSIVFCLNWRGLRLLFTGDVERRSWKTMEKNDVLKSVHFLKVSHHGSQNGTPGEQQLDTLLPPDSPDGLPRYALVSTWEGAHHGVPDEDTLKRIGDRCDQLYDTRTKKPGECTLIEFEV